MRIFNHIIFIVTVHVRFPIFGDSAQLYSQWVFCNTENQLIYENRVNDKNTKILHLYPQSVLQHDCFHQIRRRIYDRIE